MEEIVGNENAKFTDVVQTEILAENDSEFTIVEVRTEKGGKDGDSIVTAIRIGAPRVNEEMGDVV